MSKGLIFRVVGTTGCFDSKWFIQIIQTIFINFAGAEQNQAAAWVTFGPQAFSLNTCLRLRKKQDPTEAQNPFFLCGFIRNLFVISNSNCIINEDSDIGALSNLQQD